MQSNKSTNTKYFHKYFGYNLAFVTFIYCMSPYNDYIDMDWKSFDYCIAKTIIVCQNFGKMFAHFQKQESKKGFMLYILIINQ